MQQQQASLSSSTSSSPPHVRRRCPPPPPSLPLRHAHGRLPAQKISSRVFNQRSGAGNNNNLQNSLGN